MQIERIYYDERWKMWKIDIAIGSAVHVLPLSVAVVFASRVLLHISKRLTPAALDPPSAVEGASDSDQLAGG